MSGARAHRQLRVFYRDHVNGVSIPSTQPEALAANRIVPLADRVLSAADNFIGVVDRNDVILQCYLADNDDVTLELVYPEADGCLRLTLPRVEAFARLDDLPEAFDEALLHGAQYIA